MSMLWWWVAGAAALAGSVGVGASAISVGECLEASDFIVNAARARDYGMTRERFLRQMQEDFELVKAFPPELRWFAKDADDEAFLLDAARDVFEAPLPPEQHRARFLASCFGHTGA